VFAELKPTFGMTVYPNGDGLAGRGQVRWSKAHAVYHMAL